MVSYDCHLTEPQCFLVFGLRGTVSGGKVSGCHAGHAFRHDGETVPNYLPSDRNKFQSDSLTILSNHGTKMPQIPVFVGRLFLFDVRVGGTKSKSQAIASSAGPVDDDRIM